jgi:hypothetical protein
MILPETGSAGYPRLNTRPQIPELDYALGVGGRQAFAVRRRR